MHADLRVLSFKRGSAYIAFTCPDFVHDASMLAIAKVVGRTGNGEANMALWRVLLPDFYSTGHVNIPEIINNMLPS